MVNNVKVEKNVALPNAGGADKSKIEEQKWQQALARRKATQKRLDETGALPGQKLTAKKREGFHQRWVNDKEGRLDEMLGKGYSFVDASKDNRQNSQSDDDMERISRVVGTDPSGAPLKAYLMEIPEEWHREDTQAKLKEIRAVENDILHGNVEGGIESKNERGQTIRSRDIKISGMG